MVNESIVSRGIAVCSKQESPHKAYGRALAFKRAKKAMKAKEDLFMIVRDEIVIILDEIKTIPFSFYSFKGNYLPDLTLYELELISKNKEK